MTIALAIPTSAAAATPPVGTFPVWMATPGGFDAVFTEQSGMPTAHVATTASSPGLAAGSAAFLGASTLFGDHFGSSRKQPYLTLGLAGVSASQTTVTFDTPTTPGWGFALGDVDADLVTVTASGPDGVLTSAQLGAQATNNYCFGASPKPTSCGTVPVDTTPTWCPIDAVEPACADFPADSLVGTGTDTSGAYGWFLPQVPVTSLTLTFASQLGFPSFQLWLVALSTASTVTGEIALGGDIEQPIPEGTSLVLLDDEGAPVTDILDQPITIPVPPSGEFEIITADGDYQLDIVTPPDVPVDPETFPLSFTAGGDAVDLGVIAVDAIDPPVEPPVVDGPGADPLVPTGVDATLPLVAASALLLGGMLLVAGSRVSAARRARRA